MVRNNIKGLFTVINLAIDRPFKEASNYKKPFNDPAGAYILRLIASRLMAIGWNVANVKRGHGCDATVKLDHDSLKLIAVILVERTDESVDCLLKVRLRRSWLHTNKPITLSAAHAWLGVHELMINWVDEELKPTEITSEIGPGLQQ